MFDGKFSEEHYPSPWIIWFFFLFVGLVFLTSYYNNFFVFADYKTRDCIPQLVTCYLQNKINIDPLATHQLPFDQIHKAFELYHAGKVWVFYFIVFYILNYIQRKSFFKHF